MSFMDHKREDELTAAFARYLEVVEGGGDGESFLRGHPELERELRELAGMDAALSVDVGVEQAGFERARRRLHATLNGERLAIRDRRSPTEVFELLRATRPKDPPKELGHRIERFFRLFAQNQWKRERYAPSFHLDDESLDPKTFYRFPILSGGFAEELAALRLLAEEAG